MVNIYHISISARIPTSNADNAISCCGACSDMLVVDLGENTTQYKTGDTIAFSMDYMGAVRLMNSRYIGKRVIE